MSSSRITRYWCLDFHRLAEYFPNRIRYRFASRDALCVLEDLCPLPTATTRLDRVSLPAVSGITISPADLFSASRRFTTSRSCKGRIWYH